MELFPAIDVRGGRCVRLLQGDYAQETVYSDDPVAQAVAFAEAGAGWIHVVDLDAARTGIPENRDVVAAIAEAVDVPIQTGGGIRSIEAASILFDAGVERVVIGTAALTDPDLVRTLARDHRVAVGLDAKSGEVTTDGWLVGSGRTVLDVARTFAGAGVDAFVVTDISRDGTLEGPDVVGLIEMLGATQVDVVASGGVGTLVDLVTLAGIEVDGRRLAGVIAGKAIYEGHVAVAEAVALLRGGV
ncbi:MAG: 1-(5-phosphoribosyl)-5-[(5-phosphoribosylamino)methylideneamino]imidazole-4-carboxamide isomerase [Acidimicrobiaceae bacterium]|jgi:phosphoribosylformimino-5-aminoimidazole carboxamide ribotide isomerase|nr:1-(5-phosphoribosyl)-5-[(5-phosphoribosylamino)methylideneamino]imidazole-4-carboxamide isomerase [Acidimicrobiaceae bacterium]MBT5580894.1 1-(5-phosphoribosyl)-5-[(5-phosphoribosylamino)methylideneamino]imidazole-4-carboxamide isomerase [Acidimicrobiaceae bacterium]MBT5848876.1 1-(5-phosphoribosyl)-5-[(5-phosphoribosylamino)methylideneamino]imidazole-4-carboxamide isomerase [Acidimicrobiaceae bacterium]